MIAGGGASTAPSIYTEVQSDVLRVYIYVPQAYVANINVGQEVEITAAQYPHNVFKGKVTADGGFARPGGAHPCGRKSSCRARTASSRRACT